VCGEAAADADAARIFIGLGVDELSLTPAGIPKLKAAIRAISRRDSEALAAEALTLGNAAEVRALFAEAKLAQPRTT
jgi:phosphoenolpyruvate-protein kinase (PTS system EI component)